MTRYLFETGISWSYRLGSLTEGGLPQLDCRRYSWERHPEDNDFRSSR